MYYPSSENKGADQLRSYCEADLRLCFRLGRLLVFPCGGSNIHVFLMISNRYSTLRTTIRAAERRRDSSAISALANMPKNYVRWAKKYSRQDINRMAKKPIRDQLYQ